MVNAAAAGAQASLWDCLFHVIRFGVSERHRHGNGHGHGHGGGNGGGGGSLDPTEALPSVDILTVILLLAAIMYAVCLVWACRKCLSMRSLRTWNSKRCLMVSVTLVCAVRLLTILGVAAMNVMNIRAHYSLNPNSMMEHIQSDTVDGDDAGDDDYDDPHQQFFDKIMTILFDLPNCFVVTTYVLLTLVWAECFLDSRLHTESSPALRSSWLSYFMAFNATLYVLQVALYTSIFFPSMSRIVKSDIYVGITGTNFTAVALVLIFYVYLNILFSGFPYRSQELRDSLSRVSSVMTLWSLTRVLWGIATLVVFVENIELLQDSHTPVWSFVVLLLLFFVCEIVPIIALLDYSYNNMLRMMVVENGGLDGGVDDENIGDDDVENSIRSWRRQIQRLDETIEEENEDDERRSLTEPLIPDSEKSAASGQAPVARDSERPASSSSSSDSSSSSSSSASGTASDESNS